MQAYHSVAQGRHGAQVGRPRAPCSAVGHACGRSSSVPSKNEKRLSGRGCAHEPLGRRRALGERAGCPCARRAAQCLLAVAAPTSLPKTIRGLSLFWGTRRRRTARAPESAMAHRLGVQERHARRSELRLLWSQQPRSSPKTTGGLLFFGGTQRGRTALPPKSATTHRLRVQERHVRRSAW